MKSSYFVPKERLAGFMKDGAMNGMEGIRLFAAADPSVKKLLPPPLELLNPDKPMIVLYVVNITEPTFGPWYLEGGIGVMAKYGEKTGLYFFNLQLSGPSAMMAAFTGREGSGLPKKLCERILVERNDTYARCLIERNGVRLVEVEMEIGKYNDPSFRQPQENCRNTPGGVMAEGGCLNHIYRTTGEGFKDMEIVFYDSPMRHYLWEPATATIKLASSIDDPWGDIPITSVIAAGWSKADNLVRGTSVIYKYPQDAVMDTMQYLYAGRYDRCLLYSGHQIYETK